ncbi:hypothetical protein RvY_18760-1 [Ramazzottius varieornatus]|uniref:Uncharacterized protein n=1 Tax=Ramazzottius varieornatus TaxID=947166 RepID=A0A1D1W700_RAMVA|nr:hypothetical protein RvY_18760-1 [Ramazzottius varieornatus]
MLVGLVTHLLVKHRRVARRAKKQALVSSILSRMEESVAERLTEITGQEVVPFRGHGQLIPVADTRTLNDDHAEGRFPDIFASRTSPSSSDNSFFKHYRSKVISHLLSDV